jgi:hypothetical protein
VVFVTLDDFEEDFWEQNPELQYIEPFAEIKKQKGSSNIMKAIYLVYDYKSKFNVGGVNEEEAKRDVQKNFLKQKDFNWGKYNEIIEAYKDKCKTPLQKSLEQYAEQLFGLQKYINSLSWEDDDEAPIKAQSIKDYKAFFKDYKEYEALVKEELKEKRYKGGYRKSPAEKMSSGG